MASDPPSAESMEALSTPPFLESLRAQLRPLLVSVPLLTLLTGVAFPLFLMAVARPLFRFQADGSLLRQEGAVVGSELIGQGFEGEEYFHPRPSSAGDGYDATTSGGTNLGPGHPKLLEDIRRRAAQYRRRCGLAPNAPVPLDAVTCSGSGLDPHISPANAELQVPRVTASRPGLSEESVRRLVAEHTLGRQLGFLGEPRVAVLPLNLALDRITPRSSPSASR